MQRPPWPPRLGALLRVGLGLRLLFGFLLITGLAGFFVLRVFLAEVKPSVREAMEDLLVDSANLLAELAAPELAQLPPGGDLQHSHFAQQVRAYGQRSVSAEIWGFQKHSLDLRVILTDAQGRGVFDSGPRPALGQDYSRWRDVARTLRGEYGARSTRDDPDDDSSTVMHVAAPVRAPDGRLLGVLTLAKPNRTVAPFIARAEAKIGWAGALLLALSMAVGGAVTFWTVRAVRRLRRYAQQVGDPALDASTALRPPTLPGELGDLALAMDAMRQRLAGRAQLEHDVRALTHELKGPLTAIQGAAEFLQEPLSEAERARFSQQIGTQVERLRRLVDGLLALSKLEGQHAPARREPLELGALSEQVLHAHAALLDQRGLRVCWERRQPTTLHADPQALALACSNLLLNACQHAPAGSTLHPAPGAVARRQPRPLAIAGRRPRRARFRLATAGPTLFCHRQPAGRATRQRPGAGHRPTSGGPAWRALASAGRRAGLARHAQPAAALNGRQSAPGSHPPPAYRPPAARPIG